MSTNYNRMAAQADDPWISVSDLGEFAFCARAGKLASEKQMEDSGEEYEPRATVRSIYSVPQLEAEIEKRRALLKAHAWVAAAFLLLCIFPPLLLVGMVGYGVFARFQPDKTFWHSYAQLKQAMADLARARLATSRMPSLDQPRIERVDWWSLLQAGFESTRPMDLLRDTEWRLCGKPWRVLKYGSYRIPVFRKKISRENTSRDEQLYHQHYVRIAAYCRLLEATEGGNSPFGIVMFGPTYDGTTVPLTNDLIARLKGSVHGFRTLIKSAQDPAAPPNGSSCRNCPNGRPDAYFHSDTYMQSDCGTRFAWQPPHQKLHEIRQRQLEHDDD